MQRLMNAGYTVLNFIVLSLRRCKNNISDKIFLFLETVTKNAFFVLL